MIIIPESQQEKSYRVLIEAYVAQLATATTSDVIATTDLLNSYHEIDKKAEQGQEISANDFNGAEGKYNKRAKPLAYLLKQIEKADIQKDDKEYIIKKIKGEKNFILNFFKELNPEIFTSFHNPSNLDAAFIKHNKFPDKALTLTADPNTTEKFISDTLEKNPGFAIGEVHLSNAGSDFIADNMQHLKKSVVDTIYMEIDDTDFFALSCKSTEQLKKMVYEVTPEQRVKNAKINARNYEVELSDDRATSLAKIFLEAKQNGIEVVNIDKIGLAREFEGEHSSTHRVSSSNFTWAQAIKDDRTRNHKNGKYVVLGGYNHFTLAGTSKGLVDEALGIPVISFDNRKLGASPLIARTDSPNSADFYIPGGECHPDIKKTAALKNKLAELMETNPGAVEEIYTLHEKVHYSALLKCSDVDGISTIQQTQISEPYPVQPNPQLRK